MGITTPKPKELLFNRKEIIEKHQPIKQINRNARTNHAVFLFIDYHELDSL
jgi:hypothetical protein